MTAEQKRKLRWEDHAQAECERKHQESALDDALSDTFPASDPVVAGAQPIASPISPNPLLQEPIAAVHSIPRRQRRPAFLIASKAA